MIAMPSNLSLMRTTKTTLYSGRIGVMVTLVLKMIGMRMDSKSPSIWKPIHIRNGMVQGWHKFIKLIGMTL